MVLNKHVSLKVLVVVLFSMLYCNSIIGRDFALVIYINGIKIDYRHVKKAYIYNRSYIQKMEIINGVISISDDLEKSSDTLGVLIKCKSYYIRLNLPQDSSSFYRIIRIETHNYYVKNPENPTDFNNYDFEYGVTIEIPVNGIFVSEVLFVDRDMQELYKKEWNCLKKRHKAFNKIE